VTASAFVHQEMGGAQAHKTLRFTIFRPPVSTNHQYKRVTFYRNGKQVKALANSVQAEAFKYAVRAHALNAALICDWPRPEAVKHVAVTIVVFNCPRHDCSAAEKLTLDGMEGVVYENDKVAHPRTNDIASDDGKPRVEVTVELLRAV
jgi:hypothetical protein